MVSEFKQTTVAETAWLLAPQSLTVQRDSSCFLHDSLNIVNDSGIAWNARVCTCIQMMKNVSFQPFIVSATD